MIWKKSQLERKTSSEKMTTLSTCINQAVDNGYTVNFKIENGNLWDGKHKYYKPHETVISNFYRFEGESDPGDNSILYLLETIDGKRGTLIDAYGTYEDTGVSEFVKKITNMQKQKPSGKNFLPILYYTTAVAVIVGTIILTYKRIFHKKRAC